MESLSIVLFSILINCAIGITIEDCPTTLSRDRYLQVYREQCYEFVMYRELEFDNAQKDCKSKGGNLVKIHNRETNSYLYYQLKNVHHQTESVWIGLTDQNTEDKWEWMDTSLPDYTNWAPGQPGIAGSLEDCAAIDPDDSGRWHDYRCTDIFIFVDAGHRYICQYDPVVRNTQPVTTPLKTTPTKTMTTTTLPSTTTPPEPTPESTTTTTNFETTTTTETTVVPTSQLVSDITMKPRTTTVTVPTTTTDSTTTEATTSTSPPTTTTDSTTTETTTSTLPPTTTTDSTTMPTTTTTVPPPTTTVPTTQTSGVPTTTGCPSFHCTTDCGLSGYKKDTHGCALCECDY